MNEVDGLRKVHKKIQSPFEHWIFSQLISFGKPLTDRHYFNEAVFLFQG